MFVYKVKVKEENWVKLVLHDVPFKSTRKMAIKKLDEKIKKITQRKNAIGNVMKK